MPFESLDSFGEETPAAEDKGSVGVADFGKKLGAETLRIGEQAGGIVRGYYEAGKSPTGAAIGKAIEQFFSAGAEGVEGTMSPAAREGAAAAFTDPKFWEHPLLNGGLKLTGLVPMVAATALPAGLIADGIWAARAAAAAGGALNAGQVLSEIDKKIDATSDDELQTNSPLYAGLRSAMDETQARAEFGHTVKGMKPALAGLIGAAAGYIGPAANAIRGLKGEAGVGLAGRGVIGGAAVGGAEGALGGAAQAGSSDALVQGASREAGLQKDYDLSETMAAALDGGVLGGVAGGVVGAVARGPKSPTEKPNDGVQATDQRAQEQRRGVENAPVEATAPAAPEAAADGGPAAPVPGAKGEAAKAVAKKGKAPAAEMTVVDAVAPSPEQTLAIADKQQPTAPQVAPEIAAASQRVAQAEPIAAPVEPARPAQAPAEVPPEVAAASERVARPEVTPEVTPPSLEQPPAPSVAVPPEAPAVVPGPVVAAAKRVPRVLPNISPEAVATKSAIEVKVKEKAAQVRENLKAIAAEENPTPSTGKNRTKAEIAERDNSAEAAKAVFEKHVPETAEIPTTPKDRAALRERLGAMIDEAEAAGVKTPTKVGYEGTSDHVVYLRAAKDLHKKLGQKSFTGQRAREQVENFLISERAAKGGDFSVLRDTRRVEGDIAMRRDQGSVEERAFTAGAGAEKEPVQTTIAKSARGSVRDSASEERVASPGRVLTGAEKIAAIKALNEANAKPRVEANRIDRVEPKAAVEAVSARAVATAAKDTNTSPTEGQKAAGNYAKGVVKWHGMEVAIENPKGSKRSGKNANGSEWTATMPDHYGYIKRTEGADGDAVDVYMGPNPQSEKVFVIDQQDLHTSKFDEHKAMLGYDDAAGAMTAYDKAFSDGRGVERIKDMQTMTPAEFKEWVKSDKPKKASKEAAPVDDDALIADYNPQRQKNLVEDFRTGEKAEPIYSTTTADALKGLDLGHLEGIAAETQPFLLRRLKELVGDTPVHFINEWDMARLSGADALKGDFGPLGTYFYDSVNGNRIHVRADLLSDPARTAHTVIHEATHAATMRAIRADPEMAHTLSMMMRETIEFMGHEPRAFDEMRYAFSNLDEFIAEGFSNPEVQKVLAHTPVSKELAAKLGLGGGKKMTTMWDAFVATVRRAVSKIVGPLPGGHSMLEAVIRAGESLAKTTKDITRPGKEAQALELNVRRKIEEAVKRPEMQDQAGKPWALKLRTMDQLAQAGAEYGLHQVRRVADLVEMIRMKAAANLRGSEPIVTKLYELERKYKATGMWEKFTSLVHDETMANVHADRTLAENTHLGQDALNGMWGKEQHAALAARFAELPEDLRQARAEAMKYFTDQQNAMSLGIIKNRILKAMGVEDDALARRIHEGSTTDADADLVGGEHTLELIKEAKELAKIEGPYFPLMRRGDHVVRATHEIKAPSNATKVLDNEFDFASRDEAIAFAKAQDGKPTIKSRWVDKTTGETHGVEKDGKSVRVTAHDVEAVQKFRVSVQAEHVEFFPSANEARAAAHELAKTPGMTVKGVEERRFEPGDRQADMLSSQMKHLVTALERRDGYKDMPPAQKNELVQALNEASIRFLGSTRVQSRRLPRRYVEGASKDLTRNTLEYAGSTSGYLARLEHQPALDEALKAMRDGVTGNENKTTSLARSSVANEVEQRIAKSNGAHDEGGPWSEVTKRIMTVSFLDKLFSPAFNIINSLQPAMVTMPTLAGRYGVGRSFDAMTRAYRDISGLGMVGKGLRDTIAKGRNSRADTTDFLGEIKSKLPNAQEREMLDYLAARGSIDAESGMEVGQLIKARDGVMGKLDIGLGYMEGVARQMPQAIETINRAVTALASYRLERGRGAPHEVAMQKAQESVNNTQGLYSSTNAAPIFHHPVAKLSLQFKKYGQMMYHLLGQNIGKAMRNAEPGDRAEAIKTLTGIVATHVAMAGALGLPTEPFKYLLMGAQAVGLTTTGWSDVEDAVRQKATSYFGKTVGEVITKGLPHAIGLDISSRVGLDSMTSFGEPKSSKENDVKSFLFDTVAGAPVALVGDWVKGANALTSGDFTKAAELMVPMKFAADSIKAYRLMSEGKKSSTGTETMAPYSPLEAATRAIGFTPRRESEESAKRAAFFHAQKGQAGERSGLVNAWVGAKPADKAAAYRAITKWNAGKPKDAQIQMKDLTSAKKRRDTAAETSVGGIKTNKRDKYLLDRATATYNP